MRMFANVVVPATFGNSNVSASVFGNSSVSARVCDQP